MSRKNRVVTIEETGGFEQNEENAAALDNGWKDELNLAEFPIAALTDRVPERSNDAGFRRQTGASRPPADRPPADHHGDRQTRFADLDGR